MDTLNEILDYNRNFVESGEYAQFFSNKYPERGLAILSCMDTRLSELLPRALGLKNGDAKLIKKRRRVSQSPLGLGDAQPADSRIRTAGNRNHGHRPLRLRHARYESRRIFE